MSSHTESNKEKRSENSTSLSDEIRRLDILFNEGLLEEVKKGLRSILIRDPGCIEAKERLSRIHHSELEQILSGHSSFRQKDKRADEVIEAEKVFDLLEKEYLLDSDVKPSDLSLFDDELAMKEFEKNLKKEMKAQSDSGVYDYAISFLQMGFFGFAKRLLESAPEGDAKQSLLVQADIAAHRFTDAKLRLEQVLRNLQDEGDAPHFMYLMAVTSEKLGQLDDAIDWYSRVRELEPQYRDTLLRLRVVQKKLSDRESS